MRTRFVSILFLSFCAFSFGCGDDGGKADDGPDDEPFDTFQACFDDHHGEEGFDVHDAIEVCCIDHPIGDDDKNVVCGDTAADCETFVDANLDGSDVDEATITDACEDYVVDRAG